MSGPRVRSGLTWLGTVVRQLCVWLRIRNWRLLRRQEWPEPRVACQLLWSFGMADSDPRFLRATITRRVDVTNALWVIRVKTSDPFVFTAGQAATLGVAPAGRRFERA